MKMFKNVGVAIGLFCLLMASSAFTQDVNKDYDKAFDFSTLKTFSVKIATSWGNPLMENRAIAEMETALASKGWTKAEEGAADAIVMLHGATEQKKDVNTFYSGYGGWGYYGWGGGMSSAHTSVHEYRVGTLVTDIFDVKSKQLVFRGVAEDELSDKAEKNEKKLKKAVEKMFKDFPPGSKKK